MSGSTGMIGRALTAKLNEAGHTVVRLVRGVRAGAGTSLWNPRVGELDKGVIERSDAVVHLSGENVGAGLWTQARKDRIRASRIQTAELLATTIARCERGPAVFVSASAIAWYGDRPGETVTERSGAGTGFLAAVCRDWEAAGEKAQREGVRVVFMRTGLVLSDDGGVIGKMLLPFKLGLGGTVGTGDQMMSWISLDDVVRAYMFVLETPVEGPCNVVAEAVTNRAFTKALGRALGRPTVMPLPAFLMKAVFGQMAEETLLVSQNVASAVLQNHGFEFHDTEIEATLKRLLA